MVFRGAFMLAAMLALTACADAFAPAPAERQTTTAPPPARTAPGATGVAPARQAPSAPAPRISDLIGLATAQIDARIGTPELIRREGDGEVRIYHNAACILHVFAYPRRAGSADRQATHIEA
ncbi:MAG: hypothetical protein ABJ215_12115, partial [Alphaproteobacteria bacterium]